METPTKGQLLHYIDELISYNKGTEITQDLFTDLKILHEIEDYEECIQWIKQIFCISSTLKIGYEPNVNNPEFKLQENILRDFKKYRKYFDPDNFFEITDLCSEERREPAHVLVSDYWPIYGTSSFKNIEIEIFFKKWLFFAPVEATIFVTSHEMAHILLYALKHPLRENEFFTDVLAIIISGPKIMKEGRKVSRHTFGYLDDEQFNLVCNVVSRKLR